MASLGAPSLTVALLVPLIAWRVWVRFKRASGRQRLSRYRGPITLTLYTLLIGAVALANHARPLFLAVFALALLAGGALATFALRRTSFEPTPRGLFYTPYAPVGLALAALFVVRIGWRFVEVYALEPHAARSVAEFAQSPLTLGAFGLLAGYYFWTMVGLMRWRHRALDAKRRREAVAASAEE